MEENPILRTAFLNIYKIDSNIKCLDNGHLGPR